MLGLRSCRTWEETLAVEPGFAGPTESLLFLIWFPEGSAFSIATLAGSPL